MEKLNMDYSPGGRRPPVLQQQNQQHQHHQHQPEQQAISMQSIYANYLPPIPLPQNPLSSVQIPLKHRSSFSRSSRPVDTSAMGILNAEQYDDGGGLSRSVRRQQEQVQPLAPFGLVAAQQQVDMVGAAQVSQKRSQKRSSDGVQAVGEKSQKKQKLSSEDEGEDEAAKKARGRPRLDTKDETAADRRRTQIRMAQRAYRHRKETTISSLEKQVQDLRAVNEQMSNIFISLHDYAVGRGVLHREPEFGKHLQSTTERFLALAKSMQADENPKDDEVTSLDGSKKSHSDADPEHANQLTQSGTVTPQINQLQLDLQQPSMQSVWGYQVSKEESSRPSPISQIEWNQQPFLPVTRQDHQVISRATLDNASFNFEFLDNLDMQQFRVEVPDVADNYQNLIEVQKSMPLSNTLSQHETTFGRHLQRAALERGWKLINAKDPDPKRLNEVFGFCLRFETRDEIASRLKQAMERSSKDTLFQWKAPFVHLGGAGTHYPMDEGLGGNIVPRFRTGMSMGPFPPAVVRTRETAMFDDFRINIPGFEGEFFDANDVEGYLRGRGIDIPPNAEFVSVDLDLLLMNDVASPETRSDSNTIKPYSPKTPRSPVGRMLELNGQEDPLVSRRDEYFTMMKDSVDMSFQLSFGGWNNQNETKFSDNIVSGTESIFNSIPIPQQDLNIANEETAYQNSHIVTLNVTALVEEILSKVTCLGRAAGFRPSDVEAALRRTLKKAF